MHRSLPSPGEVLAALQSGATKRTQSSLDFLAENRQLKKENVVLKMNANIMIDRRPVADAGGNVSNPGPQLLPPLSTLLPLEIDALRDAVSDELLKNMGWTMDSKTGRISRGGRAIFRAGFATAIEKILDALKK